MRRLNQEGQALAEYSIILALVVIGTIAGLTILGGGILAFWSDFVDNWPV